MVNYLTDIPIKIQHILISRSLISKTRIKPLVDPLYRCICTDHTDYSRVTEDRQAR